MVLPQWRSHELTDLVRRRIEPIKLGLFCKNDIILRILAQAIPPLLTGNRIDFASANFQCNGQILPAVAETSEVQP